MSALEILNESCARNIPLELHYLNPESSVQTISPETLYAQSRLLGLDENELYLDSPQQIGKEVAVSQGTDVDAYFNFLGEVLTFRTKVSRRNCSVRLNQRMMVVGMCLKTPLKILKGQRRIDYRISVANSNAQIKIEAYETDPENWTSCPLDGKRIVAQATNFSRGGLAMVVTGEGKYHFRVNRKYFIAFRLPDNPHEMIFLIEVRHISELFDGEARKLGCMFYRWPDVLTFRNQMNVLNKFLVEQERKGLKGTC